MAASPPTAVPIDRTTAAGTWWPGLDGLRGVALAAVLVYHHNRRWLPGGYLGVSLFFTLSGFLITTLLAREHADTGRIDLPAFWGRRIRRLTPVALLGLLLAAGVALASASDGALAGIAGDIRAAALNLANWRLAFSEVTYGDTLAAPSPVTHYWSLAIEEQFYVVYPVVALLALRWGRRALGGLLAATALASFAAQLLLATSPNRAYLGTDTRLSELAIGGLAALAWRGLRRRPAGRALDLLGLAAAAGLGATWATIELGRPALFRGLLPLHAAMAVLVVLAAIHGRAGPRLTGVRPLVWVGARSYEIYVVHFPLFVLLSRARTGLGPVPLLAVRVVASGVLAALVHRLVGEPFRHGALQPRWRAPVVATLATVLVVAALLPRAGSRPAELAAGRLGGDSATVVTLAPRPEGGTGATGAGNGAVRPVRIMVAGDSTAGAVGGGLRRWAEQTGRAEVEIVGDGGCALQQEGLAVLRTGWTRPASYGCTILIPYIVEAASTSSPDVILLFVGSGQLSDWLLPGRQEPSSIGQPEFDELYKKAATAALGTLATLGVPILFTTTPVPSWNPTLQTGNTNTPGSGPITMNDAARTRRLNELTAEVVAGQPMAEMVPYAERIGGADAPLDADIRPDGLHVKEELVPGMMDDGLEADLRSAYQRVTARQTGVPRNGPHRWSPPRPGQP